MTSQTRRALIWAVGLVTLFLFFVTYVLHHHISTLDERNLRYSEYDGMRLGMTVSDLLAINKVPADAVWHTGKRSWPGSPVTFEVEWKGSDPTWEHLELVFEVPPNTSLISSTTEPVAGMQAQGTDQLLVTTAKNSALRDLARLTGISGDLSPVSNAEWKALKQDFLTRYGPADSTPSVLAWTTVGWWNYVFATGGGPMVCLRRAELHDIDGEWKERSVFVMWQITEAELMD